MKRSFLNDCEAALSEALPVVLRAELYAKLRSMGIRVRRRDGGSPFEALHCDAVCFLAGGRFEFSRNLNDATSALVVALVPAFDEFDCLVDIAAWDPNTGAIGLWLGRVSMLGQENLYAPRMEEPLLVYETVVDWLRRKREGVFILDPFRAASIFLHIQPTLGVRSNSFGRQLTSALTIAAPKIVVAAKNVRAA